MSLGNGARPHLDGAISVGHILQTITLIGTVLYLITTGTFSGWQEFEKVIKDIQITQHEHEIRLLSIEHSVSSQQVQFAAHETENRQVVDGLKQKVDDMRGDIRMLTGKSGP